MDDIVPFLCKWPNVRWGLLTFSLFCWLLLLQSLGIWLLRLVGLTVQQNYVTTLPILVFVGEGFLGPASLVWCILCLLMDYTLFCHSRKVVMFRSSGEGSSLLLGPSTMESGDVSFVLGFWPGVVYFLPRVSGFWTSV